MSKTVVAVVPCPDYRPETLDGAMKRLQEFIGAFPPLIKPNDSVFLKINHLGNHSADSGIITHPEVPSSFARTISGVTTNITVGDGLDSPDLSGFDTSGYAQYCAENRLNLVNYLHSGFESVEIPGAFALHRVPISTAITHADFVVTLPKLKTHMLTLFTGAVKNSYGYLPFEVRLRLHREHVIPADFAAATVDVFAAARPGLVVMDAVDCLEGSGPSTAGALRHLGLLIAGRDAVAVDAVACAIIGIDPMEVATTRLAHERGLGVGDLSQIEVLGSSISDVRCNFKRPGQRFLVDSVGSRMPRFAASLLSGVLNSTRRWPRVSRRNCTGCGVCVQHCPQDAMKVVDGTVAINYDECISCFCCLEFCPSAAIHAQRSAPGRIVVGGLRLAAGSLGAARKIFSRRKK